MKISDVKEAVGEISSRLSLAVAGLEESRSLIEDVYSKTDSLKETADKIGFEYEAENVKEEAYNTLIEKCEVQSSVDEIENLSINVSYVASESSGGEASKFIEIAGILNETYASVSVDYAAGVGELIDNINAAIESLNNIEYGEG